MSKVLIEKKHASGGSYVELLDHGRVKAGQYEATAKMFESADAAYTHFRPMAVGAHGHWAWNICYVLEDHITQRDEGC